MRRVGGAGVAAGLVAVLLAASVGTAEAAFSQGAYSGTTNQVVNPTNGARGPVGFSVSGSAITTFEITVVLTCSLPTGESKPLPAILRGTTPIPLHSDGSFSARVTARWLVPIELTVAGHISWGTACRSASSSGETLTGASGTLSCTGSTATFSASPGKAVATATVIVRGDGPVAFDGSPAAQHVGRTVHIKVTVATAVPDDIVQSGAVTYRAWWVRLVLSPTFTESW